MDFSKWSPKEPLFSLIESLRTNGPMIVTTTLENPRLEHRATAHKIVIVGAEILTPLESRIFYLDPLDGGHNLYETSYALFCLHAVSIPRSRSCIEKALESEPTYWGWQNPL